jgi:hypothetical protein
LLAEPIDRRRRIAARQRLSEIVEKRVAADARRPRNAASLAFREPSSPIASGYADVRAAANTLAR